VRNRPIPSIVVAVALLFAACSATGADVSADGSPAGADPSVRTVDGSAEDPPPAFPASASGSGTDGTTDAGEVTNAGPAIRTLPPADGIPVAEEPGPQPVALRIPSLGVDGNAIRPVGVEANGEYEVPIASEVGWYRFGSAPGESGSSVLAGHIAYDGENGVFANLVDVDLGSTVELTLDDGSSLAYEIVDLATFEKTALPFDDIFSESGSDRLVLITCGGNFNPGLRSYESNVVAYAVPVGA